MDRREAAALARQVLNDMVDRLRAVGVPVDEAGDYHENEMGEPEDGKELRRGELYLRWSISIGVHDLPDAMLVLATYPASNEELPDGFVTRALICCDVRNGHGWMYQGVEDDTPEDVRCLFPEESRLHKKMDNGDDKMGMRWVEEFGRAFLKA